ncbi:hypothetical protein Goshw_005484 [Gossypium schwendimanii]|uniref:Uncharacterized protein n=1 Tax=Gossypium schwendimanii TaxID=34291 RepID=A0A7J9MRV6_GOSSC|nr:hypothetical protein [Gossypium schwendimanii]
MKKVTNVRTSRHKRNTLRPSSHVAILEPYAVTSDNPQNREVGRPFYEMRSSVKVRGVHVLVTERSICQFYDAPYYYPDYLYNTDLKEFKNVDTEEILRFFMERKEIWTYQKGTAILETFNQALITPKVKKQKAERRRRGLQEDDE